MDEPRFGTQKVAGELVVSLDLSCENIRNPFEAYVEGSFDAKIRAYLDEENASDIVLGTYRLFVVSNGPFDMRLIEEEVRELLVMGASYLDIGLQSGCISARFPESKAPLPADLAPRAAAALSRLHAKSIS